MESACDMTLVCWMRAGCLYTKCVENLDLLVERCSHKVSGWTGCTWCHQQREVVLQRQEMKVSHLWRLEKARDPTHRRRCPGGHRKWLVELQTVICKLCDQRNNSVPNEHALDTADRQGRLAVTTSLAGEMHRSQRFAPQSIWNAVWDNNREPNI